MSSEVIETQMRACMCVRACVCCVWTERSLLCLQQINVPSRECGTWDKEQKQLQEKERRCVREREREEALGKQILLSSPSSNLRFFTRRLKHLGENILLEEISEDGELKL